MGFKTVIGTQGVVTTKVNGNSELHLNITSKKIITVVSESGNASITAGVTLFQPTTAAGVTGTLPTISDSQVGFEYLVLKNSGSNPLLLSGVNPIVGSPGLAVGAWKCAVSSSAGRYLCTAVSESVGFKWYVAGPEF